jgi:CheY-like chemotaxis protein
MRILLVEDDFALRDTLLQALRQGGYGVDAVTDGRVADRALTEGGYRCGRHRGIAADARSPGPHPGPGLVRS